MHMLKKCFLTKGPTVLIKYLIASVLLVFSLSASALQLNMNGCMFVAQTAAQAPLAKAQGASKDEYLQLVHTSLAQFMDDETLKEFDRVLAILVDKTFDSKAPEDVIGQSVLDACVAAQGDTNKLVGVPI